MHFSLSWKLSSWQTRNHIFDIQISLCLFPEKNAFNKTYRTIFQENKYPKMLLFKNL
jgi:hypothetical protein